MANGLLGQGSLTTYNPTFREKVTDALRGLLFSDDREGQQKAERLSNVLEFTPYGVATAVDDVKEAVGQGDYATAGMMGAMAMVPGPSPKIKAYHGSPHSFDKFSMDKIGTGEGAQAYGHGLYFAENEGVARKYRDDLSVPSIDGVPAKQIGTTVSQSDEDLLQSILAMEKTPENARWRLDRLNRLDLMEKLDEMVAAGRIKPSGSMYEVSINASPDDFLDWDKPLSEQPEKVRTVLSQVLPPPGSNRMWDDKLLAAPTKTGGQEYKANVGNYLREIPSTSHPELTSSLSKQGIPGIKYLDAGSRGPGTYYNVGSPRDGFGPYSAFDNQADAEKHLAMLRRQGFDDAEIKTQQQPQSRNYVVFDDKLIEIVRKYGIAGASAMLGYNVLNMVDPAQARQMQEMDAQRPQMARSGW